MSNPFFTAMNQTQQVRQYPQQSNQNGGILGLISAVRQFKANPMQYFLQKNLNVPANIANDPNAILNYLVQTRQISQSQVDAGRAQLQALGGGSIL